MRERGARVEAAARDWLLAAGLRCIASNVQSRFGEIDLVMQDGATLVFVEVRFRRDARFGGGAASVDAGKRRRLVRAAAEFIATHRQWQDSACRFDVIDASGSAQAPAFDWIRDAFRADDG